MAQSPLALVIHNATVHHVGHLLKSYFRLQVWSIPAISRVTKRSCYTTARAAIPARLARPWRPLGHLLLPLPPAVLKMHAGFKNSAGVLRVSPRH